jgi:glycosyltransferase involved in cell wall biosynthesis
LKKIAIHFARLGPYHLARLESAVKALEPIGWKVVALETAGTDATYEWEFTDSGDPLYQRKTIFPERVFERISSSEIKRGITQMLEEIRPDAMAIAGWGTADARACLAWCKKNQAQVIVMSETRLVDGRRVWWKEWLKSRIVRRFNGALCGGESHKRYLIELGIPAERIVSGYNVVDNEFFGRLLIAKWGMGNERGPETLKAGITTEDTESTIECRGRCEMVQPKVGPKGEGAGAAESKKEAGIRLAIHSGASEPYSLAIKLADAPVSESLTRSTSIPDSALDSSAPATHLSLPATAPEAPYFLASNRFVERKNLGRLIRAYARYAESFQQGSVKSIWPLVLLGDGELRGELQALCVDLGLKMVDGEKAGHLRFDSYKLETSKECGLVVFPGFRQVGELPGFYAGAGAFVHPALEEPWGLVINEAMASGLPVLSSRNVGAAEELLVEGKTGFLFNPKNVEEIASALVKIGAMEPEERLAMGRAAFEQVERVAPLKAFGEGLARLLTVESHKK